MSSGILTPCIENVRKGLTLEQLACSSGISLTDQVEVFSEVIVVLLGEDRQI